jgi:hypothetical protein
VQDDSGQELFELALIRSGLGSRWVVGVTRATSQIQESSGKHTQYGCLLELGWVAQIVESTTRDRGFDAEPA